MKNELLTIGPFTLYGYGLMTGLGILAGCGLAMMRGRKKGIGTDMILSLALAGVLSGYLGSKFLYWLVNLHEIIARPAFLLWTLGDGFVVYGGILGGIFGIWLYCRLHRLPVRQIFDLLIPSLSLGQGFGRLGCLLAGCCWGRPAAHRPWIIFRESAFAPNQVPLIPVQIYASILNFLLTLFLLIMTDRIKREGDLLLLYLVCYSSGRFVLEFFRGDAARGFVGPLSTAQFMSLVVLLLVIPAALLARKK